MTDPVSYDLIVIGAGQGGGPLAGTVAEAGHDVALLERRHVGGTCVNRGCTPTKTMIASARVAHLARRAGDYGVETGDVSVDLETVRQRKRDIVGMFRSGSRSSIEEKDTLDLIEGDGRFVDPNTVEVALNGDVDDGGPRALTADRIVINTGTRPAIPPIDGLDAVDFLTSTSIMELGAVPGHLLILGGGYIGLEFGQMFRRFGAEVTIIDRGEHVLGREDADVAGALEGILREDGIRLLNETSMTAVDAPARITGDELLVAAGRRPNTDALNPGAAGVATTEQGYVQVDARLATTADGIYAIGDVTGGPAFTHVSYDDYRVLQDHWLHGGDRTTEDRLIAYTLFTDPQLGRVGLTEKAARSRGLDVTVAQMPMTEGGEVMSVLQTAMMGDLPVGRLRAAPFAHPTLAESLNNLFAGLDLGPAAERRADG
jgi:pyruvate/2-oxoglutarate dehydrogenase complex dihydrolipoamide dehydrogenase (E3) component